MICVKLAIAYLEIGTNDLCKTSQSAETFARQIISFASYIRKGFGVDSVIIGQILHCHPRTFHHHNDNYQSCRDLEINEFKHEI